MSSRDMTLTEFKNTTKAFDDSHTVNVKDLKTGGGTRKHRGSKPPKYFLDFQKQMLDFVAEQRKFNQFVIDQFKKQEQFNQFVIDQFKKQEQFNQHVLDVFKRNQLFQEHVEDVFKRNNLK